MNRRIWLLFVLIFGMLIAGLAARQGWLVAFAIPLAVYLGAALVLNPDLPQLEAARHLNADCVNENTNVTMDLHLTNTGAQPATIYLADNLPAGLEIIDGETSAICHLRPGDSRDLHYTLRGKRGSYRFDEVTVSAYDELGLTQKSTTLRTPERLLVVPQPPRLRRLAIRPLRTHGFFGPYPARQSGAGVDFFGLREYQPGDRLRWVNWKASAHQEEDLFTNLFEQERIAHIGLILDAREQCYVETIRKDLFEHAVSATASLAEAFLNDGNRVGLLVYGWGMDSTFPAYGKVQRERILRALARAEMGINHALEQLDSLPTRFFPPHSQIVLISPLSRTDSTTLTRLRAWGYPIIVVSPDPVRAEASLLKNESEGEWAFRLARIERTLILRKLQAVGVQVVDWDVRLPLDGVIHTSLAKQPLQPGLDLRVMG